MYAKIVSAALLGLSAVASARPATSDDTNAASGEAASLTGTFSAAELLEPTGSVAMGLSSSAASSATSASSAGSMDGSVESSSAVSGSDMSSDSSSGSDMAGGDYEDQFPGDFPNIDNPSKQLDDIQRIALGQLPQGNDPPPMPKEDSLISLGLIAFNELFEVAFFTELIDNITTSAPGYDNVPDRDNVLRILTTVQAQEELHELNANGAFETFVGTAIEPCKYSFPVDNFEDAIALASTFTNVVLSTLPDIQTVFGDQGDVGLIRGVGSVIGQEGEQNGFYHQILGQVPNQLPFLTGGSRDFAFNAILQNFVVPDSCPNVELLTGGTGASDGMDGAESSDGIEMQSGKTGKGNRSGRSGKHNKRQQTESSQSSGLRLLNTLTVVTDPNDFSIEQDIYAEFSFDTSNAGVGNSKVQSQTLSSGGLFLTYINQQNAPFSVEIGTKTDKISGPTNFKASFPGKTKDLNGLTIAALTKSKGPFASPDDVADDALFGPALIEVNQKIADLPVGGSGDSGSSTMSDGSQMGDSGSEMSGDSSSGASIGPEDSTDSSGSELTPGSVQSSAVSFLATASSAGSTASASM